MILPMISMISDGIEDVGNIYNNLKYYDEDKYRYNVSGTSKASSAMDMDGNLNISKDYFKVLEKEKGVYADFDYSNKDNPIFSFNPDAEKIAPFIMVNKEYLKDYEIRTEQGEIIDINAISENTLFIPEKYRNKECIKLIMEVMYIAVV